jgi:hypothetical protein
MLYNIQELPIHLFSETQNASSSNISPELQVELVKKQNELIQLLVSDQMPLINDSTLNGVTKLVLTFFRGGTLDEETILEAFAADESNDVKPIASSESNSVTDTKSSSSETVSLAHLLALFSEIIESEQELQSETMMNRINDAVTTCKLAMSLAAEKCKDAQTKFAITLTASIICIGVVSFSTVRMAQPKGLKDKHVQSMSGDKTDTLKSMDAKTRNDYAARMQDARTGKWRGVSQGAEMAQGVVGNVNEMQNAARIKEQEETQATKDMKEKLDAMDTEFTQKLTQSISAILETMGKIAQAKLPTNR